MSEPNPTPQPPLERLLTWPRTHLANVPTPLFQLQRLGYELGSENLWVKMDAETGFALGGNKVRKLEFELAPERRIGVTSLITAGGPQSNHCRVTAAFAARFGLRCVLVTNRAEVVEPTGNALLHRLFGAEIVEVDHRDERVPRMEALADDLRADGESPLVVPIGASTGLGCLGYALAAIELMQQLDDLTPACSDTVLFCASSSGGTLAGLLLGLTLLGRSDVRLVGVSADTPADELDETCRSLARDGASLLGSRASIDDVRFSSIDDQVGEGYGLPTPASLEATELFGRRAGIVLDPTYTSKAAAGLIAHLRREPPRDERVVFLHTGGAPGLLA